MVQYASGSLRFTGLGSDFDFDGMIDKLVAIESRQVTQLTRWKKDWQTRLEAFKALRGELMNVQSTLNGLNSVNKFLVKKATSSEEKHVTATADADALNTTYKVEVGRLATFTSWTKEDTNWHKKDDVIADTSTEFSYSYKGKYRTIKVPKGTTVEGFMKLINNDTKNPGVTAQMVQSVDGIAFQLRGNETGKTNTLVIRDTGTIKGLSGMILSEEKYEETENSVELVDKFASGDLNTPFFTTGGPKTFIYNVNDKRYIIDVQDGDSINSLVTKINNETPGIARLVPNGAGTEYTFVMQKDNSEYSAVWDTNFEELLGQRNADGVTWDVPPKWFDSPADKILPSGSADVDYKFTVNSSDGEQPNNKEITVTLNDETTLTGLVNSIKFQLGDRADVTVIGDGGNPPKYALSVEFKDKVHRVNVEDGTLEELSYTPPRADGWTVKHGDNAQVRFNDVPDPSSGRWMEVASNTLKAGEVFPGITFNLHKAGETTEISVSNDTSAMTENIQAFVDAINSFRTLLMSYTQYDEEKETVDLEYAESQFEMQKGGILQGNYGVQMLASRLKNCIAGSASGFLPRIYDTDGSALSGDLFSSLSQIGITTNANQGEANYGLLEINYISGVKGSKSLDEALRQDPEAVAKLFAVEGEGSTSTDDFSFYSHLPGITKPGNYAVKYEVDVNGDIINASIGGSTANYNKDTGMLTAVGDGPAKGIAVLISDDSQGLHEGGSVTLKAGKIGEFLSLLEGSDGILGSNGTLRNLEKNYQGIIDGIEKKIKQEDDRLTKWEKNMKLKFARLETVLAKYNQMNSDLESQIAQLGSNKK